MCCVSYGAKRGRKGSVDGFIIDSNLGNSVANGGEAAGGASGGGGVSSWTKSSSDE